MILIIEFLISSILTVTLLVELIKIYIFKKDNYGFMIIMTTMFSLIFGLYLWIKNGMMLDYGTTDQIAQNHAPIMFALGITNILTGLLFILNSILKFILGKVKKNNS